MEYLVQVTAACDSDVWTKHPAFLQAVKNLIDGLNVDYKFKIFSAGAQRSSYDTEDLLAISRKFTAGLKMSFCISSLSAVQLFESNLASECAKVASDYLLKVRVRTKRSDN